MSDDRPVHSKIGASSMYRWENCPGSVALSEGKPNVSSVYAQEGTAAHEFVGLALERAFSENRPAKEVMLEHVKALCVYTEYVEELKKSNPAHVEHSFDMVDIFDNLYGTADCVIYDKDKNILHVIDYKHGVGIPVEAEDNAQLSYYALGALTTLGYPCAEVQMTIVQPRCYHPMGPIRHWRVSALHFIDFEIRLVKAAKETLKKKAALKAGGHCQFCLVKSTCPEKAKNSMNEAKKDFAAYKFYKDPKKDFDKVPQKSNELDWLA